MQFDSSSRSRLRLKSCSRPPLAMKMYFHSSVRTMTLKLCEPGTSTIPIRYSRGVHSPRSILRTSIPSRNWHAPPACVAIPKRSARLITQKIAVVGKKTDKHVLRVRLRFDCIKDSAKAMIEISDLAVVSGFHDFRQGWVDGISPDRVSHVRNLFIQMVFF